MLGTLNFESIRESTMPTGPLPTIHISVNKAAEEVGEDVDENDRLIKVKSL